VLRHSPNGGFSTAGRNDTISYSQPATRQYDSQVQKIPEGVRTPVQFSQAYRDLLTRLQLAHTLVWVGLTPSEYNPEVVETVRSYNDLASEAARALNIPVRSE